MRSPSKPPAGPPVAIGQVIAERYRVDGVVGEGGMGVVVSAMHLVLQQRVAIKFLRQDAMGDREAVKRFVTEARAAAKVKSEYVVNVHDVATLEDGTPYIVMEFVEGNALSTLLETRGALPVNEAVRYMVQACEALAETHAAGIVHGDLKPDNIYIAGSSDGGGRVKLLDFGIANFVGDRRTKKAAAIVGTPGYMAPEQVESGASDPRSDIWALGAVLYEMLSGDPPFGEGEPDEICKRVIESAPKPIERGGLPERLKHVVHRCLNKNPALRYRSAVELAYALEDYAPIESSVERVVRAARRRSDAPLPQKMVPTVLVPRRTRGGKRVAIGVVVGAAVVASAATWIILHRRAAATATSTPNMNATAYANPTATTAANPTATAAANANATANPTPSANTTAAPTTSANDNAVASAEPAPKPARAGRPRVAKPRATTVPAEPPPPPAAEGDRFGTRK